MPYRVEVAKQGRAGCKNKECKDSGIKIDKGELRYGSLVTIHEHTSWVWKHWGCVTPAQIANLIEESGGDTDMVDGYDELPSEMQEKVQFALANGHVPDEDWKGDVEVNRPGQKGFRVKATVAKNKKKRAKDDDDDQDEEPEPQTQSKKKRGRLAKQDNDEDEDEELQPKKKRGRPAKKDNDGGEDEEPQSQKKRGRPAKDAPAPKKARGKKAAVKKEADYSDNEAVEPEPEPEPKDATDDEDTEEVEAPKPKPKRGGKKSTAASASKPAPQKRGRKKKAAAETD